MVEVHSFTINNAEYQRSSSFKFTVTSSEQEAKVSYRNIVKSKCEYEISIVYFGVLGSTEYLRF